MFCDFLIRLVKDESFAIDSIQYSQEFDIPLSTACEEILDFHIDMMCIAVEEGSALFN